MNPRSTILVTGATGFIGGWIVETLHLTGRARPRAGIRTWSRAARLGRFPVDMAPCDVLNRDQIAAAMKGAPIVVHCAIGPRDVIVEGTRNVLAIAASLGVERVVHLSTTEVYGEVSGDVDEGWPYRVTGQEYNAAKIEAEKIVWEHSEKGVPVTILRPPIVYGPFGKDFTLRIAHRLESGQWGVFDGVGEGLCNLIYVSDVVAAVLLAAEHEAAIGEAFNINGPEAICWNDYFERFNKALGLPPLPSIGVNHIRLRAVAMEVARAGAKSIRQRFETRIKALYKQYGAVRSRAVQFEKSVISTPRLAELRLYNRRALYRDAKARRMLGYRPRVDIDTGLDLSVRWIRHLGVEAFM